MYYFFLIVGILIIVMVNMFFVRSSSVTLFSLALSVLFLISGLSFVGDFLTYVGFSFLERTGIKAGIILVSILFAYVVRYVKRKK